MAVTIWGASLRGPLTTSDASLPFVDTGKNLDEATVTHIQLLQAQAQIYATFAVRDRLYHLTPPEDWWEKMLTRSDRR